MSDRYRFGLTERNRPLLQDERYEESSQPLLRVERVADSTQISTPIPSFSVEVLE